MLLDEKSLLARERLDRIIKLQKKGKITFRPGEFFEVDAKTLRSPELLAQFIKQKEEGNMSGGNAAAPKRENLAYRLDGMSGTTNTLANEIAKTTNAIREALMGCPPSAIAKDKEATEGMAPLPGFLCNMIARSEDNNRTLNYVLDELRTVLGEIS